MQRLQQLINDLGLATVREINQAIFAHPDAGLIEALGRTLGEEHQQEILSAVADALKVPLLSRSELQCDPATFADVSALAVQPLVAKHHLLPLAIIVEQDQTWLKLAMADPMDLAAVDAVAERFSLPVAIHLARQRDIVEEFSRVAGELQLRGRREAEEQSEQPIGGVERFVEDAEVRKAINQLTATAVKHRAKLVVLPLDLPTIKAEFSFPDSQSTVEISASPLAAVAALMRRGQVVESNETSFSVLSSIPFKALTVTCRARCRRRVREVQGEQAAPIRFLELNAFYIDQPEDPGFWQSVGEGEAALLRELFANPDGVFIAASPHAESLEILLRSLTKTYPDLSFARVVDDLSQHSDLFQSAANHRVLIGLRAVDAADVVEQAAALSNDEREKVRGVVVYRQLPRLCECCAERQVGPAEPVENNLPAEIVPKPGTRRKPLGCVVCNYKGFLGMTGAISILKLPDGEVLAGERGSGLSTAARAAAYGFQSLLESGLQRAETGITTLSTVLEELPDPGDEYWAARRAALSSQPPADSKAGGSELNGKDDSTLFTDLQPLRGADVFFTRSRRESDDDDGPLIDDHLLYDDGEGRPVSDALREAGDTVPLLLVIDDDPDQRDILRRVFEMEGYRVEVAADGVDGIVCASRLQPNLIIVDFMMPDLDGRETINRLKKAPATTAIPVVALTAYADPDVEFGLLKAGADDFCAKSVSKKVLLQRISRLLAPGGARADAAPAAQ